MSDLTALSIPNDLAACQALIRQQAHAIESHVQTIESHVQTIESHVQTIESHVQTIDAHVHRIESHETTIEDLQRRHAELQREHQELRLTFAEFVQRVVQRRSERYLEDPNQLKLDFPGCEDAADAAAGLAEAVDESRDEVVTEQIIPEHKRRVRRRRNEQLPKHLPRHEVEAPAPEEMKRCPQHGERKVIGYDVVETLEFERPKLWVRVTKYPKYACENQPECGVASPERAVGLVEGNRFGTSVATEIITGKFGFHMPVYREQDYFAGSGWTPARSTLLNVLTAAALLIRPLVEYFKQQLLASGLAATDDTRTTLLLPQNRSIPPPIEGDPKSQRIHEVFQAAIDQKKPSVSAHMWAYRGITIPLQVFDFTVSRHRDGPELFLTDFAGTLLGDCYAGFEGIALRSEGAIVRAACNAHARRKVHEAIDVYPREASQLLGMYQQLYDIEARAKLLTIEERLSLRQREAAPVWQALGEWLGSPTAASVLPKSKLGEALRYLRNHWDPLRVYLNDGRLPIDNNETEQLMKQIALGRKNWLFVGSVAAGERTADFFTLVSSAVRNDLDVWAYIKDVLDQLLAGSTDYASLRPNRWRESHPEFIRQYRVEERRDRADRMQRRRAARRRSR